MCSHDSATRAWLRRFTFLLAPPLLAPTLLAACSDGGQHIGAAGSAGVTGIAGNGGSTASGGSAGSDVSDVGTGHGVAGATPGSWAYLVYMLGDNNLEAFTTADLEELMQIGSSDALTILVQLDRAEGESSDAVGGLAEFSGAKRLRVEQGALTELEDLGEINSGTQSAFQQFLTWGITTAPADHYAVVLWDHGGAWAQFGADSSANNDGLTMSELDGAMRAARVQTQLRGPFDLLGFDACLLGSWEVASALQAHARYMLASEELEPGHGWDHRAIAVLKDGADAETLGSALIDGFAEQAREEGTFARVTLALTRLEHMPMLGEALTDLTDALATGGMALAAAAVGKSRAQLATFGKMPTANASMVDLLLWGRAIERANAGLKPEVDALTLALDDAIAHQIAGEAYAGAGGLSIFFPSVNSEYHETYDQLSNVDAWRAFLTEFHETASEHDDPPRFTNVDDVALLSAAGDGVRASGTLAAGSAAHVASVALDFGLFGLDGTSYFLGETAATISDTGVVSGVWDRRSLVASQGDRRGNVSFLVEPSSSDLSTISIPLLYTDTSETTIIVLVLALHANGSVASRGYYTHLEGVWAEHAEAPGSTLTPLIPTLVPGASEVEWVPQSTSFDATLPLTIEYETLASGSNVFMRLRAVDFAGQSASVHASGPL